MSDESLLTAARRVVRFVDINAIKDGGLITNETLHAVETLRQQVQIETDRQAKQKPEVVK